jgi:anti-sigma factor RsiW
MSPISDRLEQLLWAELDGALSAEERAELAAELAASDSARELAAEVRALAVELDRLPV